MKYPIAALLFALVIAIAYGAKNFAADPPETPKNNPVSALMQMKLERSKSILEALAMEDFDAISRNARALRLLSLESGWNVRQSEEYATQSREFRRATDMIASAAEEKDLSRATLGYIGLTVRCVECHSFLRKQKSQQANSETP